MLTKTDSTIAVIPVATACGNCGMEERRLLHHVRLRGVFRRLCTSCVLRLHPESFCPTCFQVYPPPPPRDAVVSCSKCHSSSHSRCVAAGITSSTNSYICPLCINPGTPVFKLKMGNETSGGQKRRVMDRNAAKKLLAAAKIASSSMNKAVALARQEAEKRSKEAALARKRAKEALEHVAYLVVKDKLSKTEVAGGVAGSAFRGGDGVPQLKREINSIANNRNVPVASGGGGGVVPMVVDEKINTVGNVDRVENTNSNQVLAALNSVELTGRNGDRTMMDVDRMRAKNVSAERINGGSDRVMFSRGPENHNVQRDKQENVDDDEVVVVE